MTDTWIGKSVLRIGTKEVGRVVRTRNGFYRVLVIEFTSGEYELLLPNVGGSGASEKEYAWWMGSYGGKSGEWVCFDMFGPKNIDALPPAGKVAKPKPVQVVVKASRKGAKPVAHKASKKKASSKVSKKASKKKASGKVSKKASKKKV